MRVHKSEQVVWTDIDDTLIVWDRKFTKGLGQERVWCPFDKSWKFVHVHGPHVRLLRERKARGAHIVAMSHGGHEWAKCAAIALGLDSIIDDVYSKPVLILDDLPVAQALGETIWLNPHSPWKAGSNGP